MFVLHLFNFYFDDIIEEHFQCADPEADCSIQESEAEYVEVEKHYYRSGGQMAVGKVLQSAPSLGPAAEPCADQAGALGAVEHLVDLHRFSARVHVQPFAIPLETALLFVEKVVAEMARWSRGHHVFVHKALFVPAESPFD